MSITSTEKSDRIRKLGRGKFVLRYGVLGWGISTAILFSLITGFTEGWDGFVFKLIPALIIFPLGGYVWGRLMWAFFERTNKRAVSE
jgi:hypothetical protein